MGFFNKLQFWKKSSDDFLPDSGDASGGYDSSFTGTPEQSGFSQGNSEQGMTGQQAGDLPPLDMSSNDPQQQYAQNYNPGAQGQEAQGQFIDPNSHMGQQQQAQDPFQNQQSPQQQSANDQVTMSSDDGDRRIGKHLAEEYMKHQRQESGPGFHGSGSGVQASANQNPGSKGSGGGTIEHSLELINVKLDSLKNGMDAMSQRLLKIENDLEKERKRNW